MTDYSKEYNKKNRKSISEKKKKYYEKNRKSILEKKKKYRQDQVKRLGKKGIKKADHKRYLLEHNKYKNLRKKVISYYSNGTNTCVCCGTEGFEFLTIDHIIPKREMDKIQKMKDIGYSSKLNPHLLISWLDKFHPEGFQILCWNCNYAKGVLGKCPHQK